MPGADCQAIQGIGVCTYADDVSSAAPAAVKTVTVGNSVIIAPIRFHTVGNAVVEY
jgi:hypothetical protein